jgi:hypothetical protein
MRSEEEAVWRRDMSRELGEAYMREQLDEPSGDIN